MTKQEETLNERQKEAVATKEGPLLILAGAGAGKTKTITHRIIEIIRSGVMPREILAITFTNKAAKEMRERIFSMLRNDPMLREALKANERPFVSTFHSLGVEILKEHGKEIGLPRHFTIYDRDDSKKAIKEATVRAGLDPKQFEPGQLLSVIGREKGNMTTARRYEEKAGNEYFPRIVGAVWQIYEQMLARDKALDFDDLLLKSTLLLKDNPRIREYYQNRFRYIHIDEYQDTNRVQYEMSRLLAEKHSNICAVGDIDQNIYSWRGADIKNILSFEEDYPDAKVILLEENYRSTQTILTAANAIIEKNKHRRKKTLFTKNASGEKISLYGAYDEVDEAYFVANKAAELIRRGVAPREIAVLFRANFQSRILEEAFLAGEVPYQVLGVRLFERKEVKDVLSFLRASLNPESLADIARIINVPPRGIGKVTILKVFAKKEDSLPPATRQKVADFFTLLERVRQKVEHDKPSAVIKFIIRETGLEEILKKGGDEDLERLENVQELVTLATRYDGLPSTEGIERLITDAALASDQDEMEEDRNVVKLMTVHASKGLEFEYVFITGLEENLFPHKRLKDSNLGDETAEEERRLFYVALTRTKKKLFLVFASTRTIFGSKQTNTPSQFITDLDDAWLTTESGGGVGRTIYFD
ncbi:MAG: UvrD-helicase domain-containing protein [bacterium]|nr:UvrD-helicase domain-containing protein [bacterium]